MAVSMSSSVALGSPTTTAAAQEDPTTAALNKISPALGKAHGRVQSQLQSDSTSLSQLGKYKATVADLASAAPALSQLGSGTGTGPGRAAGPAEGTLKLDTAALNKALTAGASTGTAATGGTGLSTLAQLGKAIGKRADNELASSSRLATATSLFSGKTTQLKQQQTRLLEAATQMSSQASASTGTNTSNWSTQQALRKYLV